jgi:hypothetical protein
MKAVRVLYGLFVFLGLPVLGYLLGATIFIHFWDKVEVGDLSKSEYVAVAQSCERHGPIAVTGFGYRWQCQAELIRRVSGDSRLITTSFLKPEHIGKKVAVGTTHRGTNLVPDERPYQGLGGILAMVFGVLWIFVLAWTANPLLKRFTERARAKRLEEKTPEPTHEVFISGGRKRWLRGRPLYFVLGVCTMVGVNRWPLAFTSGATLATILFLAACAVPLVLLGNGLRRALFGPFITISPDGLQWGTETHPWADIARVRLSADAVLSIEPHNAEPVRIGPFGEKQVQEIDLTMRRFGPSLYRRDPVPTDTAYSA